MWTFTSSSSFLFVALSLLNLISHGSTSISKSFEMFLANKYGAPTAATLKRADLGGAGSFGGGNNGNVRRKPVILVHGITNTAGTFDRNRKFFLAAGYADKEVYGTTYSDGGKTNVLFVTMECQYIKQVRMLITTVADYTNSRVNVIGYSMGSPVARKAIMGGACVDTGENLGPPLTSLVRVFVGVAGANFGSVLCVFPFGSCNMNNGMHCMSRFLADINSRQHYEGDLVFSIYSKNDDKVGYQACGKVASAINGQNGAFEKTGMNHDQVIFDTVGLQHNLVTHGHP